MKMFKKLIKWVFWIFLIIALVVLIGYLQMYVFYKDKNDKADKSKKVSSSENSDSFTDSSDSAGINVSNEVDKLGNIIKGTASDVIEEVKTPIDRKTEFNQYNFDDRILLYEGEQLGGAVNNLIDLLIKNTEDSMFSRPNVTLYNGDMGEIQVLYSDVYKYVDDLNEVKSMIFGGKRYEISFGYGPLHAVVNEIIITKK